MRDIPGYEGLYAVTENGEIWSYPKMTLVGRNGGLRKDGGKFLNQYTVHSGHLRVYLFGKVMQIHRATALAYLPNPERFPFINHMDGNPANNHLSNLEWCNAHHNSKHAFDLGLTRMPTQKGEANSRAKLTEDQVRSIRKLYAAKSNASAIARQFGLNPKTVWEICKYKKWKHIIPE